MSNTACALKILVAGSSLSGDAMANTMREIMRGEAPAGLVAAFLTALRMKGESVEEITQAANVLREFAAPFPLASEGLIDIVGTGGDGASTLNVSTASAIVAAACGARVAKHGNRSVSSRSGAADLLEAAGVHIGLNAVQVAQCIDAVGIGFLFAPMHHSAMRFVAPIRKELGIRTIFNVLGPLTNPARPARAVIGVFEDRLLEPIANCFAALGANHVMVVHGQDGLDEISINGMTRIAVLHQQNIRISTINPAELGIRPSDPENLKVRDAAHSLALIQSAFRGEQSPAAEIIALNSAAALIVAGIANDFPMALQQTHEALRSGAAWRKLQSLIHFSQQFVSHA
jgi:anthranilate phosphoribosyltransferase